MPVWFDIRSASGVYSVVSERNALAVFAPSMRAGIVLADSFFADQFRDNGIHTVALEANEATKGLAGLDKVIVQMREAGATRDTHLWAVGGGVIQDVAGFVSSIYMRGISWTYIPTTLLGMVDSCIGGKSSINVGAYKNIVGTFHTPTTVLIDATLASTLNLQQRIAGLIEAAKICYCRGADVFRDYLSLHPMSASSPDEFERIASLSLQSKKWFVETDEFDRSERLLLNLGHTFGHALESASNFRLSHGVAVGVGILCAIALAGASLASAPGSELPLLRDHVCELLGNLPELPHILREIDLPKTLDRLKADKKHEAENYRFVTFDAKGDVQLVRLPKNEETRERIAGALRRTLEQFLG